MLWRTKPHDDQCICSVSATSVSAVYPPRVKGKQAADVQVSPVRLLNAISNVFEVEAKHEKESNSKTEQKRVSDVGIGNYVTDFTIQ